MKKILALIAILLVLLFLYGSYIEVKTFKVKEYTIQNENIPESFEDLKIIQFSDLLYERETSKKTLEKVLKRIENEDADIIIFTGDLLKKDVKYTEEDYTYLKETLTKMTANLYKFAVIGDNDESNLKEYKDILYESNFILLDNQNKLLFYKDEVPINIIGITDPTKIEDFNTLLTTDVPFNYSLVITHKPDNFNYLKNYNINTVIAGHSLGGIINIPYYGGIFKQEGAKTYLNDYYKENNQELFISNGLGYEKYNFRLFNNPSINIYRFSNEQ